MSVKDRPIDAEDLKSTTSFLSGVTGVRIFPSKHIETPFGTGPADNRFAVRTSPYTMLFFAEDFETAFLETLVRDRYVGTSGTRELPAKHRSWNAYAEVIIAPDSMLPFLDLRDDGCHQIRVPTDTVRGLDHTPGRDLGARIYAHHQSDLDGVIFRSRHNARSIYAVFSWALDKLRAGKDRGLIKDHPDLVRTMRAQRIEWRD